MKRLRLGHRVAVVAVAVLVLGYGVLHYHHLDVLLWKSWRLNSQTMPEQALNLGRYRVEIDARVVEGVDDDLSALTYNSERNTLFSVLNGQPVVVELSLEGELLRWIPVSGVRDMEGLTHVEGDLYVIAEERTQRLMLAQITDTTESLDLSAVPSLTLALDQVGNKGFEGLSWDDEAQRLLVVKERQPLRLLAVEGFVHSTAGDLLDIRISELKASDSRRLFMRDLSSLTAHSESGHLLLLSDESRMLVEYDDQGRPLSLLGLWRGMHGLARSVPQAEGLAIDSQGRIYIVSEPNLFYRFVPGD
ncbi:MAG: SdiA-regulated domain-containing protein [Pseudomonas sp.]